MNNPREAYAPSLDGLTDEQINAMPEDDFCDALYASLQKQEALITCEQMDEIEQLWETERRSRRACLLMLTKPWAWLNEQVMNDREFALIAVQIMDIANTGKMYQGLADLMGTVSGWTMAALASRGDMSEVMAEARADN